MDKELKRKWVEALRSGKYKQGRERLKRIDGDGFEYCCLGVLCEVGGLVSRPSKRDKDCHGFNGDEVYPPNEFRVRIGLTSAYALAELNDNDNKSFTDIADWIEENL